jgi:hypothetical protein
MFASRTVQRWRRFFSPKILEEPRPHIVPLTPQAEAFVLAQIHRPCQDALFSPFYTGYGYAEVDGRMVPAFRFMGNNNLPAALALVQDAFAGQQKPA